jgi:hypothetical protein
VTFDQAVTAVMARTGYDRVRAEAVVRANPHVVEGELLERALVVSDPAHLPVLKPRMNGLEIRRAAELEAMKRSGMIRSYQFEAVRLVLADRTSYTPDFLVELNDRALMFEETKGHWRDDARVKIKVAARLFPMFRFVALTPRRRREGGGWNREDIRP